MSKNSEPFSEWIIDFVGHATGSLEDGFYVMLLFGYLHSLNGPVPPYGYWTCVFITFVITCLCGTAVVPVGRRVKKVLGYK